jgi:hypothetical protein
MTDISQTPSLDLASLNATVRTTIDALPVNPDTAPEERNDLRQAVLLAIADLGPTNLWEAMFAAQATTAHYAMMEAFRRAALPDLPDAMVIRLHGTALSLARLATASLRELRQAQATTATRSAASQFQAEAARCADPTPPAATASSVPPEPGPTEPGAPEPEAACRNDPIASQRPAAPTAAISRVTVPPAVISCPGAAAEIRPLPPLPPEPVRFVAFASTTVQQDMQARILAGVTRDLRQQTAAAGARAR